MIEEGACVLSAFCFVYLGVSHFHVGILIVLYICMSLWSCIVYGTVSKPCFLIIRNYLSHCGYMASLGLKRNKIMVFLLW